jgi:hypothetical protein
MLQITIPEGENWDEGKQEFVYSKEQTLQLEHSLVSLSKWESKWNKVFLSKIDKTNEEVIDYIKCMTITQNVDSKVYQFLSDENLRQIDAYISAPMTATFFMETNTNKPTSEQVTSELIYYWMIALNIPFTCEKWHLNRLLMLINVCNRKNKPPKKRSKSELMTRNAALNAERRKLLGSTG